MPGDENDRKPKPGGDEFPLKVESALTWQAHIENETGGAVGRLGFEKVGEYGFPVGKTVDREFILKR